MKHFYLIIFLVFSASCFSQESQLATSEIEGFGLYPNPVTTGKIFINTLQKAPKQIHIFDVLGTQVLQTTILGNELNLSNLDKGVYIIRVFEKGKVATRKLIVK